MDYQYLMAFNRTDFSMKISTTAIIFFSIGIQAYGQSYLYSQYKDLEGNYISIQDTKGEKFTVLDFWATWCKPCVKSIPEIVKLNDEFVEKGVTIIGVDVDSPRNLAKVRPFALSKGIDYPVILDVEQELMTALNVSVLPTFIILDSDGKVVYTHEGFVPGEEKELRRKLEELSLGNE